MELTHELTLRATLDTPPLVPGPGPDGNRLVASVRDGSVSGPRIRGTLQGAGADWAVVRPDGFARLDVRVQIVTDDGAAIYVQYGGLLEQNDAVRQAMTQGGETGFDDQYFRSSPTFETGDERYAWLTRSLFVGRGRIVPGGVEYEVFRVG